MHRDRLRSLATLFGIILIAILATSCSSSPKGGTSAKSLKIGKPYSVNGQTFMPAYQPEYDEIGMASWYGPGFHGKYTANGERFDQHAMTAAHPTLPMPSMVRVTNLRNGKHAIVRINDRGPFASNRIIDLSKSAAKELDLIRTGTAQVRVQYLPEETREYVATHFPPGTREKSLAMLERKPTLEPRNVPYTEVSYMDAQAAPVQAVAAPLAPVQEHYLQPPKPAISVPPGIVTAPIMQQQTTVTVTEETTVSTLEGHDGSDQLVASPAPVIGGNPHFYIQAGSFGMEANARKLADQLSRYAAAMVNRITVGDREWYRVRVGPFENREEADVTLAQVVSAGVMDARIVRD